MGTDRIFLPARAGLAAAAAALLLAGPGVAATKVVRKGSAVTLEAAGAADRLRVDTLTSFAPNLTDAGKFSFTAPGQTGANARMATAERAFRFTPSGKLDSRRAFSIGVTSRVTAPVIDTSRAAAVPVEVASAAPAAYNVDLAVGWRNFAVSGGYGRADTADSVPTALALSLAPRREALDAGVSYRGASWKTSLQVAAEEGPPLLLGGLTPTPSLTERRYSVEVGGAYSLTPRLSVNGGLKYKETLGPSDPLRRDQAVYLGTAFTF